jgi:DNA-binding CsgD family transcriptional regulator
MVCGNDNVFSDSGSLSFRRVKVFFPDIIQLHSIAHKIFESDVKEFSVLVDSRAPLHFYDYLIPGAAERGKCICCIVLDMRHREEHLLSLKWFLNMSLTPTDMANLFSLFLDVKSKRLTREWLRNFSLKPQEHMTLTLLRAGMTMEQIAEVLNTSVKSLYRKRIELYERLGLANFNEACLFIFKNRLLERSAKKS